MSKCEPNARPRLDLTGLRQRLAAGNGPEFWRSLEELAGTEEFEEFVHREFPENASEWHDESGRRRFLKLMAASLALAGLSGCTRQPTEKIVPYVRAPEEFIPGKPLFYATAMSLGGYAVGVLAESHMGRPTKIEGNPSHPASLGATDIFAQASILGLYDPDRSQVVMEAGRISTWASFLAAMGRALQIQGARKGSGIRVLTETVTSPALAAQLQGFLKLYPEAKWHQYDPIGRDNAKNGAKAAFGSVVETVYRFDKAAVIVSLDADFLTSGPGNVRYARDFISRRRVNGKAGEMNRLYAAESTPTSTGAMADHRLVMRAADVEAFARALAGRLGVSAGSATTSVPAKQVDAIARDLQKNRGASIIIAGEHQPPVVHWLAHAMNQALGNVDSAVYYADPVEANPVDQNKSLRDLVKDMSAGRVEVLIILGGNPVYNAPADLKFGEKLTSVRFRVHLSLYDDETSNLCHWHINETHYLEAWGETRAFDGTFGIQQPLIAPLYAGKSIYEVVAALSGQAGRSTYDIIRDSWKARLGETGFETTWRRTVHDGLLADSASPPRRVTLNTSIPAPTNAPRKGMEVIFRADSTVYDGRFANIGWLQELPKTQTRVTWDSVCMLSPKTAEEKRLATEDLVVLNYEGRTLRMPVWVTPGHPDGSATVFLGYGRTRAGGVGTNKGQSAYALRPSGSPWIGSGLEIVTTGERYQLASTQEHWSITQQEEAEKRHLVREATLEHFHEHPDFAHHVVHEPPRELTLYEDFPYEKHAWGMAIDLNACIGCNACVVACQSENNIPVVGKEQVARGREMHWIRIDRYYQGNLENPTVYHQPIPCMHCENASCEVVCPVAATSHSAEGLNDMTYNRCVGTRYCSNNCPYKVRRFNFLQYSDETTPVLKLMRNPNVTVRSRGVMEKCTYCVQRINAARITAEREGRPIGSEEIVTACQQACPTQAIVFGDINNKQSRVAQWKADPRNYALLGELNNRPRTTYLAKLCNPNPEMETEKKS